MVKTMMIPQAVDVNGDDELAKLYAYCNSVMEPWDGPAAIAAVSGDWVIGGMDRNGLRPMRYTLTDDGLIVAGSETGMVHIDEARIIERGRLGPGEMIGVNLANGRVVYDAELKKELAGRRDWAKWTSKAKQMDSLLANTKLAVEDRPTMRCAAGANLCQAGQWKIWSYSAPMASTGKEAVGSMGDDAPLAVLSGRYRGLHHFFRQNFSQVTNPPIDSLRERHVMTLRTRLGNLGNILDESPEQCDHLVLQSPVVSNSEWYALKHYLGDKAVEIDCSSQLHQGRWYA